jgi:hypothetical protein
MPPKNAYIPLHVRTSNSEQRPKVPRKLHKISDSHILWPKLARPERKTQSFFAWDAIRDFPNRKKPDKREMRRRRR